MSDDTRIELSRWALDSARHQGEVAAMFLNSHTRQDDRDDNFAVVYATKAARAALFFLGREDDVKPEEYIGIPNVPAIVHRAERFRNMATIHAEEILPRILQLADSECGGSDEQLISELARAFEDFAEGEIAWRSAGATPLCRCPDGVCWLHPRSPGFDKKCSLRNPTP